MMNRVLDVLKWIWKALRTNLGLKIISLIFAVILWNYVIAEVNPPQTVKIDNLNIRINGETVMKQSNLTIKGDKSQYFKTVSAVVQVTRRDLPLLKPSDVTLTVDLSTVTHDGKQDVRITGSSTRGTVVRVEPETISLNIERLSTKFVPVIPELTGTLPDGFWHSTPELNPNSLTVTGARSDIEQVDHAVVRMSLDNLTGEVSRPCEYILMDANNAVLPLGNMTLSTPNCIASMLVYPTKMVTVKADDRLYGNLPEGYQLGAITEEPAQILVAGPASVLDKLDTLTVPRIDVTNATNTFSITRAPELPNGVVAVDTSTVSVSVGVERVMVSKTLDKLPITVTGLGNGLIADEKLSASVIVTLPEVKLSRLRNSMVHLYVDADGLSAGTYTLPIRAEMDPTLEGLPGIITPSTILVTIRSATATTAATGGP